MSCIPHTFVPKELILYYIILKPKLIIECRTKLLLVLLIHCWFSLLLLSKPSEPPLQKN